MWSITGSTIPDISLSEEGFGEVGPSLSAYATGTPIQDEDGINLTTEGGDELETD